MHFLKLLRSKLINLLVQNPEESTFYIGAKIVKNVGAYYDNTWAAVFHISRNFLTLLTGMMQFILQIIFNFNKIEKLTILEIIHFIFLYLFAISLSCGLLVRSRRFKSLYTLIKNEFGKETKSLTVEQQKVEKDASDFTHRFIKISLVLFYWACIFTISRRPLFERTSEMTLMNEGWMPFEVNTWFRYTVVCIFQTVVALNLATIFWALLATYVTYSKQICSQLEILSLYIKDTFDYNSPALTETKSSKLTTAKYKKLRLKLIIQRHQVLLRCLNLFQETYSLLLFGVSFNCGLVMCTAIYMDPQSNFFLILEFVNLLVPELALTGCYCWFGQQMKDWWTRIGETVYDSSWYMEPITIQKALLNMLTISNKNKALKGAGLQEFSLKGSSELLQASFTYFNMLKAAR
ncbi:odorant receptor 4-like isoform X2 [Rhodnius prolixus]|uniref:odorant receptor 4-like isoform X2 n=1 Tax=Rhodnius prolixus TaxID=13249 RepID=UPI003D188E9D